MVPVKRMQPEWPREERNRQMGQRNLEVPLGQPRGGTPGHLELRRRSRSGLVVVLGESPAYQ